ncbi:hypothetical protein [Mycolicibacterium pulveris]|uniref:hypothetical protein n=1 Tax=Mycolicibacterium pulveris TaxID=36813 RepID=UPI001F34FC60|nr:hypothetical protein [Mycolicibacterium pulveris]
MSAILTKLAVSDRREAIRRAQELGTGVGHPRLTARAERACANSRKCRRVGVQTRPLAGMWG